MRWCHVFQYIAAPLTVLGQSYDYGLDIETLVRRQDVTAPVIVGRLPLSRNGTVPLRLEIRDMQTDAYKWELLMLALSMFQYVSQNNTLSWYQIAGIHGVPFATWDGVAPEQGAEQSGYCTHSSVLFPIWHRPYLALYEQEIWRLANIIASMYPDASERRLYQQAASDMRIPYWDWASEPPPGQTLLPDVFWSPTIVQNGPNGLQTIRNPLYAYPFHPLDGDAMVWTPFKYWEETKRAPDTSLNMGSPPSSNSQVNDALVAKLPEIQQRLFILFSSYSDFNAFGNKAWAVSQNLTTWDSIESIHDVIHIYGGLKGHMTYVPLSAFDPLFWFHHAMTDRLIAMWQILNPEAWMIPMAAGETSYSALKGTIQGPYTPLTPFRVSESGMFWNSDMARNTQAFGYAYADTDPTLIGSQRLRSSLTKKIIRQYGKSSPIALRRKKQSKRKRPHGSRQVWRFNDHFKTFKPDIKASAEGPPASAILDEGHYTEWIANVHVNVEALDGTFEIHFFIGQVPSDCTRWKSSLNQVGTVGMFIMDRNTGSKSKVSGSLPLTAALTKLVGSGVIPNLDPSTVGPFLRSALQFRVLDKDDHEIPPHHVDGLGIRISSANVTLPAGEAEFPKWGDLRTRYELWP